MPHTFLDTFNRNAVRSWMRVNKSEHVDPRTGELNATQLAESAAQAFDQNHTGGPLDDPDHWIWELAIAFVE